MTSSEFDIAIIGGGCIGTAVLHELSRRGFRDIVLVDQGRWTSSATTRSAGMVRVFHEQPEHIELALAHQRIQADYQASGVFSAPQTANGSLYFFSRKRAADYRPNLKRLEEAAYPHEVLNAAEGRSRFPQFLWKSGDQAVFEPTAGHRTPDVFISDLMTSSARSGGYTCLENFDVRRICRYNDRYRLAGDTATVTARSLILAGGARLMPRLLDLGVSLPLESRALTVYLAAQADGGDPLPNYFDRETLEFARLGPDRHAMLSTPTPHRVLAKTWGDVTSHQSAPDCYAPNRLGLFGHIPGHPRLILATGWGGTAFKFSLALGRRVADAIEQEFPERRASHAF